MVEFCAKCNLALGSAEPRKIIGRAVLHVHCFKAITKWLYDRLLETGPQHQPRRPA